MNKLSRAVLSLGVVLAYSLGSTAYFVNRDPQLARLIQQYPQMIPRIVEASTLHMTRNLSEGLAESAAGAVNSLENKVDSYVTNKQGCDSAKLKQPERGVALCTQTGEVFRYDPLQAPVGAKPEILIRPNGRKVYYNPNTNTLEEPRRLWSRDLQKLMDWCIMHRDLAVYDFKELRQAAIDQKDSLGGQISPKIQGIINEYYSGRDAAKSVETVVVHEKPATYMLGNLEVTKEHYDSYHNLISDSERRKVDQLLADCCKTELRQNQIFEMLQEPIRIRNMRR